MLLGSTHLIQRSGRVGLLFLLLLASACTAPGAQSQPPQTVTAAQIQQPSATATSPDTLTQLSQSPLSSSTPIAFSDWRDYPIIPEISQRAIEIYNHGLALGNDPHRFSKIGDCQNITTYFLAVFEDPELYSLGPDYASLQDTIDWYRGSFGRESLAVAGGLNVARVLSPFNADPKMCLANENSLACEVRVYNPSIALVSLEENWGKRSADDYDKYMRSIIDFLISQGVLPILATKADDFEGDNSINVSIAQIAADYQIPIWNFWRAVQPLPGHGLLADGFHLTQAAPFFDQPDHMKAGWPWRNLTALQSIDAVRTAVTGN